MNKEEINALHAEFRRCGKNAREWMRQCQMMLPRIRDEEVWKKKGFSSIYEYAAKLAGMSHNSVNEALRILDCLEDKPELKKSVEKFGLNKVSPVITIATENTAEFWADKVGTMSVQALKTYVREYRRDGLDVQGQRIVSQNEDMSNRDEGNQNHEVKTASIYMKLDVKTIERLKKMKRDDDWDELLNKMLDVYEDKEKMVETKPPDRLEKPSPVNTGKRYVPVKIKRHVIQQASGLCAYPGCAKPYEILHHTKRFAIDATHDPDTIKPLCKAHERLAHKGLIENEESQPVEFTAGGCGGEGELSDSERSGVVGGDVLEDKPKIQINWAVKKEADKTNRKYGIDQKVNMYYMPKLE